MFTKPVALTPVIGVLIFSLTVLTVPVADTPTTETLINTFTVPTEPVALTPADITSLISISKPPATTGAIVPVAETPLILAVRLTTPYSDVPYRPEPYRADCAMIATAYSLSNTYYSVTCVSGRKFNC